LGAVTGYQSFSSAIGNSNTTYYTIADQNGANWEVGYGTYSSSGNTLARTTVLASSNSGSLVNFSGGLQNVWCDYPAGKSVLLDSSNYVTGYSLSKTTIVDSQTWTPIGTAPTWANGLLWYDSVNGFLDFYNGTSGQQNDVHLGSEIQFAVYNNTGSTIPIGSAVYINGQHAQIPTVALAKADSATTANCIGLTNTAIANNTTGYVVVLGKFTGVDTSAMTSGQTIYLSASTAGGITSTLPSAPNLQVVLGYCTYSNPSVGVVELTVPLPAPLASSLVGQVSVAHGGTGLSSLPVGYIPFGNGTSAFGNNGYLFWDNTNVRLGVGTSSPITLFQVNTPTGAASTNWAFFPLNSTNPPAGATSGILLGSNLSQGGTESNLVWGQGINSSQYLAIGKWTGSAYTEQMRIDSSNNVIVGGTTALGRFSAYSGVSFFGVGPTTYDSAWFGPRPANDGICSVLWKYGGTAGDFWKIETGASALAFWQYVGGVGYNRYTMDSGGNFTATNSVVSNNTITAQNNINTVGGVMYGAGTWICTFTGNIDANANRAPGVWGSYASGATNAPDNSGILWNGMSGGAGAGIGDGGQLWQDYSDNKFWTRKRWGGSFGGWTYIGG